MRRQAQASDAQLRIGESRDSGFIAAATPRMTVFDARKYGPLIDRTAVSS
jgi:hypothetical protein